MKKEKLRAVFDEDLVGILKRINVYESFERGELLCEKCHTPISTENLQLIIPRKSGKFEFVCSEICCVEAYYSESGGNDAT